MHKSIITQQSPGLIKGHAPQIFTQATKLMQLQAEEEKNKLIIGGHSFRDNGAQISTFDFNSYRSYAIGI